MRAVVSRNTGFALVAYASLVATVGTTLPTPLYPLFAQRYSFGDVAAHAWSHRGAGIAFSAADAALVLVVLASLSRTD